MLRVQSALNIISFFQLEILGEWVMDWFKELTFAFKRKWRQIFQNSDFGKTRVRFSRDSLSNLDKTTLDTFVGMFMSDFHQVWIESAGQIRLMFCQYQLLKGGHLISELRRAGFDRKALQWIASWAWEQS